MSTNDPNNELPHSPAAERNKAAILEKLKKLLIGTERVFEIGSGTGQHAIHFAKAFPELSWQTSEIPSRLPVTNAVLSSLNIHNVQKPYALDVTVDEWPEIHADIVYTANTAHIMPWEAAKKMLIGVAKLLKSDGLFIMYGPFKYEGEFTSESNHLFDMSLKSTEPHQGIRDFEAINRIASEHNLFLQDDYSMPANNQLLVFKKQ